MRLLLCGIAIVAILAACIEVPPIQQRTSPLVSPLSHLSVSVDAQLYMPIVRRDMALSFCEHNAVAHELAERIRTHPAQERKKLTCHLILVQVAQSRAKSMVDRQYFGHCDPDGICANRHVERAGYRLPDFYHVNGNNIESIAGNQANALHAFDELMDSPGHRSHLMGEISFYREQDCYGVGYVEKPGQSRVNWFPFETKRAYVVITAPCP